MWIYEKKLEFPVKIKTPNPKLAQLIISQYGGLYCNNVLTLFMALFISLVQLLIRTIQV